MLRLPHALLAALLPISAALALAGCGAGLTDEIGDVAPKSASCTSATYPDSMGYSARLSKYSKEPQCSTQVQAAESYRQSAIANCSAGQLTAATSNYDAYKKSVTVVNSFCP